MALLIGDRMQFDRPKRRDFMTLVGGAAVAWPLAAWAHQPERMRRIGVLMALPEADPAAKELLSEFTQGLAELGWTAGGKMRMDVRWTSDNVDLMRKFAMELVALQPDVILANSTAVTAALQRETQTIPIVFAIVGAPVGSGFLRVCHARVGTSLGLACLKRLSRANGWICSRRLRQTSSGSHSCSILTRLRISIHF